MLRNASARNRAGHARALREQSRKYEADMAALQDRLRTMQLDFAKKRADDHARTDARLEELRSGVSDARAQARRASRPVEDFAEKTL